MRNKPILAIAAMVALAVSMAFGAEEKAPGPAPSSQPAAQRGPGRQGPGARPRPGGPALGAAEESFFLSEPMAKDDAEKKILDVLTALEPQGRRMMNVPREDGRLLRVLTEALGAKQVVEIGTSDGYSGLWFCLALRTTGGKLMTHEIDPQRAALARENFQRAGVGDIATVVEGDAHEKVKDLKGPIDILFLDADKEGYLDYLNKLLPLVRPGGLIIAHNINPRMADPRYVEAITKNPDLESILVNSQATGVGVTLKKR
ncbi:MAG: class I SAM-dependent methyltransferase [Candidatus Sumerlaeota bacterium]|nr:class I SAM-dependent methyltransferase [Candidatus Sumerlaeota bacterium]